jgi:NADH-quinone oxidoreductase subunit L
MLFLIAGSLIHAVHHNDLDSMGGLGKKMPWTYAAALIGCLAISGIPPFSGFFSKDEILIAALQGKHFIVFGLALLTSGLTAFYMFRFFFLAFHGNARSVHTAHVKESFSMTLPIVILAIPSFLGGYLFKKVFLKFFTPGYIPTSNVSESLHSANWVPFAAAIIALIGIFLAWVFYARPYANVKKALDETNRKTFYKWIYHKFYFDEIYYAFVRQFIFKGVAATIRFFEDYVVGGAVKGSVFIIKKAGELVREAQSGFAPFYIGTLIVGLLLWRFLGNLPV